MKPFNLGDAVYVVKCGYVDTSDVVEEPRPVTLTWMGCGLVHVRDRFGLLWEIPGSVICHVPEGHVWDPDSVETGGRIFCLACDADVIVPYRGPIFGSQIAQRTQDNEED